jgi:hypothetical protein
MRCLILGGDAQGGAFSGSESSRNDEHIVFVVRGNWSQNVPAPEVSRLRVPCAIHSVTIFSVLPARRLTGWYIQTAKWTLPPAPDPESNDFDLAWARSPARGARSYVS